MQFIVIFPQWLPLQTKTASHMQGFIPRLQRSPLFTANAPPPLATTVGEGGRKKGCEWVTDRWICSPTGPQLLSTASRPQQSSVITGFIARGDEWETLLRTEWEKGWGVQTSTQQQFLSPAGACVQLSGTGWSFSVMPRGVFRRMWSTWERLKRKNSFETDPLSYHLITSVTVYKRRKGACKLRLCFSTRTWSSALLY